MPSQYDLVASTAHSAHRNANNTANINQQLKQMNNTTIEINKFLGEIKTNISTIGDHLNDMSKISATIMTNTSKSTQIMSSMKGSILSGLIFTSEFGSLAAVNYGLYKFNQYLKKNNYRYFIENYFVNFAIAYYPAKLISRFIIDRFIVDRAINNGYFN